MKLPSGIIIPDNVPDKHLLLPKLAGGAPSWKLPIKSFYEKEAQKTKGFTLTLKRNLLQEGSPTLMTEWMITDIRIPVLTRLELVDAKSPFVFTFGVNLLLGGDIVWSAYETVTEVKPQGVENFFPATFAENFTQPIVVPRGRALEMEMFGTVQLTEEEEVEITLGLAGLRGNGTVASPTFGRTEGMISYYVQKLSGHRTL